MFDRQEEIDNFLRENNWSDCSIKPLAADASFRKYFRLEKGAETLVLMDAPPPMENIKPFTLVAKHLRKLGFNAPFIVAEDEYRGLLLLDDFGDNTYTRLLSKGADEKELYRLAVDVLIALNKIPVMEAVPYGVPDYDDEKLLTEVNLFTDWYMPSIFKKDTNPEVKAEYVKLWTEAFTYVRKIPETLVLRDYHVDNLMKVNSQKGLLACGLLDFQDAVKGPMIYDIMSLMEDARRDIDTSLISEMRTRYLAGFDGNDGRPYLDLDDFDAAWAVLAACRHAKVIGIFTRLCVRDKKPQYLVHIPRLWRLLENALEHRSLFKLKNWFTKHVPLEIRKTPNVRAA